MNDALDVRERLQGNLDVLVVGSQLGTGGAQLQQRHVEESLKLVTERVQFPYLASIPLPFRFLARIVWLNVVVLRRRPRIVVLWQAPSILLAPFLFQRKVLLVGAERNNPFMMSRWRRKLYALGCRRLSVITVQTRALKADIRRLTKTRAVRVPNVLPSDLISKACDQISAEKAHTRSRQVAVVARLAARKRVDVVLSAFDQALGDSEWTLVIVGDGPERVTLEGRAGNLRCADRVIFKGMLGRSATLDILSKSRVAVAFSEWDGYPNAVIEAAMLSDVVVSSDCDYGPREILAGRPRSYLVPSKQESELAGVLAEAAAASKASDLEWSEMSDWLIKFIKSHAAAAEVWDNVVVGLQ